MRDRPGFWERIRGNAEWEAVKVLGGSGMLTSIWQTISASMHHAKPDWILWGIIFLLGGGLSGLGYWRQSKVSTRIALSSNTTDSPTQEELAIDAEQKKWHELVEDYNLKRYYEMGVQSSQLFTPIQLQALQLAKDLGTFVLGLGPEPQSNIVEASLESALQFHMAGPGSQWNLKLQSHYEERFSPRIKKLLLEMGKEGQSDLVLSSLAYAAKTSDQVALVRARLWMLAALREGIRLEVADEG